MGRFRDVQRACINMIKILIRNFLSMFVQEAIRHFHSWTQSISTLAFQAHMRRIRRRLEVFLFIAGAVHLLTYYGMKNKERRVVYIFDEFATRRFY